MGRLTRQIASVSAGCCVLAMAIGVAAARADEVRIGRLPYSDVKVTGIEDGQIVMLNRAGNPIRKPLGDVTRVQLDGNDDFNRAELLLEQGQHRLAWQAFERTRQRTNVDWLRTLIDLRLLEAYQKDGEFARAVEVFLRLADAFPDQARALQPTEVPPAGSRFNAQAIEMLDRALADCDKLTVRTALTETLLRVLEREGSDRVADVAGQLAELLSPPGKEDQTAATREAPRRHHLSGEVLSTQLTRARALLTSGQHSEAVRVIDGLLAEAPEDALDQLWMLKAEALQAMGERAQAALAAMQVVIEVPNSTLAPRALAMAAAYYESIDRPDKAIELYQELCAHSQADAELIAQARAAIGRLEQAKSDKP
jgi:tetratricopeptide (TPR) repeat protein